MCYTPVTINRGYRKINARWTDAADRVPCGKCPECLHRRSEAWALRLYEEMKISKSATFLTLTYNEEHIPYILDKKTGELKSTLNKKDFQLFMKSLRKINFGKLKYYTCGEYGTKTNRPHYHSVMFNLDNENKSRIEETWKRGNVKQDPVNMARIRYVTKYITKKSYYKPELDKSPEFALMSKNMGMSYLTEPIKKYHKNKKTGVIVKKDGIIQPMPRYYKEKIFTKLERKEIAEEQKKLAEIRKEKKFTDPEHELIWKKDQYRKIEKNEKLKRSQI